MGILDRLGIGRLKKGELDCGVRRVKPDDWPEGKYFRDFVEEESDEPYTTLFASAPEMLESIIEMILTMEQVAKEEFGGHYKSHSLYSDAQAFKSVVEKATNRTWAEIKKMMEEE